MLGIKLSSRFTAVMVTIKVAIVLAVIVVGGMLAGAALVFFAFIGFDIVATTPEETKNPQRDIPRGILGSQVICTLLYVLVSLVVTGMQKYTELNPQAPLAEAFSSVDLPVFANLISLGAVAGLTSVMLILLLGQSRVLFAMSRDRRRTRPDLPRAFRVPLAARAWRTTCR